MGEKSTTSLKSSLCLSYNLFYACFNLKDFTNLLTLLQCSPHLNDTYPI